MRPVSVRAQSMLARTCSLLSEDPFLSRYETPVNFLDLDLTLSCVSTSPQVSLYWMESVKNLTQNCFY